LLNLKKTILGVLNHQKELVEILEVHKWEVMCYCIGR